MKNILQFGCGHHGERIVEYLKKNLDFNLYVIEINEVRFKELLLKYKNFHNLNFFKSIDDFEKNNINVDFGIIANWVIDRKKNVDYLKKINCSRVMIEKPFASSLSDLYKLKNIHDNEFLLIPSLPNNFSNLYLNLNNLIDNYEIGEIQSININCGAKGLINNGIHYVDIANNLFKAKFINNIGKVSYDLINPRNKNLRFYYGNLIMYFENEKLLNLSFNNKSMVGATFDFIFKFGRIVINENGDGYLSYVKKEDRNNAITRTKEGDKVKLNNFFGDYISSLRNNIDFFINEDDFNKIDKFFVKSSTSLEILFRSIYKCIDEDIVFNLRTT